MSTDLFYKTNFCIIPIMSLISKLKTRDLHISCSISGWVHMFVNPTVKETVPHQL